MKVSVDHCIRVLRSASIFGGRPRKGFTLALTSLSIGAAGLLQAEPMIGNSNITLEQVKAAQQNWGQGLIQISADFQTGGIEKATETARNILEKAYGFQHGPVLFKPTLTQYPQTYRLTLEGALAYFVGNNPDFPNDNGFALKGWTDFSKENAGILIHGNTAMTLGRVRLTNQEGEITEVDKTWGFLLDSDGAVRIVLHHSSLPFTAL